jgi:hypothetical protein
LFGYKYSLNGQEKSTEIEPGGSSTTAEFWQYDARLGRRWNMDPVPATGITDYATFYNNPIQFSDPLGNSPSCDTCPQSQSGILFPFFRGVKNAIKSFSNSFSSSSLNNAKNGIEGSAKDFGNMLIAKPGAAASFGNRITNTTLSATAPITEVGQFLGSMYTNTPSQNAYGIGNYATQFGILYGTDRFISDINFSYYPKRSSIPLSEGASSSIVSLEEGGLNLYKFSKPTTEAVNGWKTGDRMIAFPKQATTKLDFKLNNRILRTEMRQGKPIFDSYRYPSGQQIPDNRFTQAERLTFEFRGWKYDPATGAYHPPF